MLKRIVLYLFFVCCAIGMHAQQVQYQFSQLDFTRGLSNNQVNCIFKDAKGFMWFGTMSGLNRYDGYKVKVFRHSLHDSLTLADDYVPRLYDAPGNKLFIQTRGGNSVCDPLTESFVN